MVDESPGRTADGTEDPVAPFDLTIPDAANASPELRRAFWRLVVVFNLGVLATAVGGLLIGFEGDLERGGALLLMGVLTLGFGVYRYRRYRADGFGEDDPATREV